MSNSTKLLSKKDVMDYLQISMGMLDKLIKDGKIPFTKVGRQYRFYKTKIDEYLLDDKM